MKEKHISRIVDMKKQHEEYLRQGYDGHNIHSGIVTTKVLSRRRNRRIWNFRLNQIVKDWNSD